MRKFLLLLFLLFCLFHLLFSKDGLFEYMRLKKKIAFMAEEIKRLEAENASLEKLLLHKEQ